MDAGKIVAAIVIFNIVTSIISKRAKQKKLDAAKQAGKGEGNKSSATASPLERPSARDRASEKPSAAYPSTSKTDASRAADRDSGMDADRFEGAHPNKWRQDNPSQTREVILDEDRNLREKAEDKVAASVKKAAPPAKPTATAPQKGKIVRLSDLLKENAVEEETNRSLFAAGPSGAPSAPVAPANTASKGSAGVSAAKVRAGLRNPDALRQAFVLKTILDKPLSLQRR